MPYRCEKYHTCYHHRSASFCSLDLHTIYYISRFTVYLPKRPMCEASFVNTQQEGRLFRSLPR